MVLAIPTKNRTAAFSRCLESLRDNADKFGKGIEFLVLDDSDDGSNLGNQRALEATGVPYRYYTQQDVNSFAVYLSRRARCPLALTHFLFKKTPTSHGAVRNFLTLMSASEPFIMIDDDMVCKFANVPGRSDEIEYVLKPKPHIVYPAAIIHRAVESQLIDDDFIGKHEALLKKVALSVGGSIGDSGVTHSYVFFRSAGLLAQMVKEPEAMLQELHTRQLLRSTKRPQVVNHCCCVGMSFGLNPSHNFPPFFPFGRSEDVLFGGMLAACYQELSGYCNYSMWHSPYRPDTENGIFTLGNTTPPEFFYKLLAEIDPNNLEMLSQTLIALSSQKGMEWVETKHRKRTIAVMREACVGLDLPDALVREIDKVEAVLRDAPPYEVPYDLMRQFGELLQVWPQIVEVARDYGSKRIPVRLHASTV